MNTRTVYSTEEKMDIVLGILSRKTNIQSISREKGIAPTLISLWKKQAMDAMEARLRPQPKGRRKAELAEPLTAGTELRQARNAARSARIKSSHLENSLLETRERLTQVEEQLRALAGALGYKLVKEAPARRPRKA